MVLLNKQREVLLALLMLFLLMLMLVLSGDAKANNQVSSTSNLYKQTNGAYWWLVNNTRRWISESCGREHEAAGTVAKSILYSELEDLPRDGGPCPSVSAPTVPTLPTSNLYQQSPNGTYWWLVNNTRRWISESCGREHEAAGAVAKSILYSELEDLPRDGGPCPSVGIVTPTPTPTPTLGEKYKKNLEKIRQSSVRNTNHDNSPYRNTPSNKLVIANHSGSRLDYLGNPGGNPEEAFPVVNGGQNRTACEFSHFAYDDPLVHPNKPGAAHLHMFFGNTDVNAYSTYDSLINSGSSTCNGQELNRTGYWAPAMFDGNGNVRIPERVVVYYKGEGLANGRSEVYPEGAAMITKENINEIVIGGAKGKFSFVCSDQYSGASSPASNTMPNCDGNRFLDLYGVSDNPHAVLEMNVKFPQCWNGKDPSNPDNYSKPKEGNWYYSKCDDGYVTLPNLEYFINYRVEIGEDTSNWYLSSDVDPMTYQRSVAGGTTTHADWWGGWNKEVNKLWIDNCVNYKNPNGTPSGCGMGYLTDGGPDGNNPYPGPALKYRPQYAGPSKVSARQLFNELCDTTRTYGKEEDAAYCKPEMTHHN